MGHCARASAPFVANMEDVLEVYQRPRDPERPVVCLDETSKQMIVETREPQIATHIMPKQTGNSQPKMLALS
jgi:hypothetical protein